MVLPIKVYEELGSSHPSVSLIPTCHLESALVTRELSFMRFNPASLSSEIDGLVSRSKSIP